MHTPAAASRGVLSSAFDRFPGQRHLRAHCSAKSSHRGFFALIKAIFFRPYPALHLLLAADGLMDTLKAVVMYRAVAIAMILAGRSPRLRPAYVGSVGSLSSGFCASPLVTRPAGPTRSHPHKPELAKLLLARRRKLATVCRPRQE